MYYYLYRAKENASLLTGDGDEYDLLAAELAIDIQDILAELTVRDKNVVWDSIADRYTIITYEKTARQKRWKKS